MNAQNENDNGDISDSANESNEKNECEKALQKRKFVLHELIETEGDYVQHLGLIAHGYMAILAPSEYEAAELDTSLIEENGLKDCDILVPDDLKSGKEKMIFGNILNIYKFHME